MRHLILYVLCILLPCSELLAANIGTISIISDSDKDGYSDTETPLQIKFVADTSFNESTNCLLQCSLDGKNWRTIKYYEGSITQNCTLQVQYPDLLPTATDDCYFNNMGNDIFFRIYQDGNTTNEGAYAKFVCKPKYIDPVPVYRTINSNGKHSLVVCIIPENFQNLNWSDVFNFHWDVLKSGEKVKSSEPNCKLEISGSYYIVKIDEQDGFYASNQFQCQIQAINIPNAKLKEKIEPNSFLINIKDIPAIPSEKAYVSNLETEITTLTTDEPTVDIQIVDKYFRAPYTIKKGDVTVASNIKLNNGDTFGGNTTLGDSSNVDKYIKKLIENSWWKWQAYYQQKYNAWREEWVTPKGQSSFTKSHSYNTSNDMYDFGYSSIIVLPVPVNKEKTTYNIYFFCFKNGLYKDAKIYRIDNAPKAFTEYIINAYDKTITQVGNPIRNEYSSGNSDVTIDKQTGSLYVRHVGSQWFFSEYSVKVGDQNWNSADNLTYYVYGDDDDLVKYEVTDDNSYRSMNVNDSEALLNYSYKFIDANGNKVLLKQKRPGYDADAWNYYEVDFSKADGGVEELPFFHYGICGDNKGGLNGDVAYYDGEYIHYAGKTIRQLGVSSMLVASYDSQNKCYYVMYSKGEGPYRQNFLPNEVPTSKVDEWKQQFTDSIMKETYSNDTVKHKLENIITNRKETYTLVDADGCESTFHVYVETKQIEATSMLATLNGSSYDYKMTVKYLDMGTMWDEGKKQSATRGNTMEISGLSQNGTLAFTRKLSSTDSDTFTYDYDFGAGITNVQATYCKEAGGTLLVTYTPQTASDKLMLFKDGNAIADKTITTTTTTTTSYKFSGLADGSYTVKAVSGVKTFVWSPITLSSYTFAIDSDKTKTVATNVTEIEGKDGECSVTVNNAIGAVKWTWNGTTETDTSTTLSKEGLPANSYKVTATQNGCTVTSTVEINAPAIVGNVSIRQSNDTLFYSVSDVEKNDSVADNYSVVLKKGNSENTCNEITSQSDKPSSFVIDSDSNNGVYNIVLKYRKPGDTADKEWKIGEFKIAGDTLVGYSLAHKIDTTKPTCYEKNLTLALTPIEATPKFESNIGGKFVTSGDKKNINNTILGKDKDKKQIDSVCYKVKNSQSKTMADSTSVYNPLTFGDNNKTSSFTINYSRVNDCKIGNLSKFYIDSLTATVTYNDFLCSYSGNTDIVIDTIKGGYTKGNAFQYKYVFINSDTTKNIGGLPITGMVDTISVQDSGSYTIYIRDTVHDCPFRNIRTYQIKKPSPIEFATFTPNDPICELMANGSFDVKAEGGSPKENKYKYYIDTLGQDYQWDTTKKNKYGKLDNDKPKDYNKDSILTDDIVHFGDCYPGKYKITVFDSNQCVLTKDTTLRKYQNPYVSAATFDSVSCYGLSDGAIMVDSIHGTAPVNIYRLYESSGKEIDPITLTKKELENVASLYIADKAATIRDSIWTHESGDAIVKFENLPSANYYLCLTDTNNCATIVTPADEDRRFSIKVEQPDSLILFIDLEDTIIANYGMPGGEVNVHAEGGNKGRFLVSVDDTVYNTTNQNLSVTLKDIFLPGRHCIKAEDSKQCADTAYTGIMRQPDSRLRLTAQTVDALCKNKTGAITVAASGGWGVYQYSCPTVGANLGHGDLEYTFTGLYGGVYKVSVTDSARAVFDTTIIVNTPPELLAMPVPQDATCRDDGRIAVNLSGGVMPYRVFADFADTIYIDDTTYTSVAAFPGYYPSSEYAYEVYVMDSNDCTALAPVVITDSIPKASVKFANPSFHNVSNGNLTANVSKGTSPYSYLWTNRNTGATFTGGPSWKNISAGTYSLVVTDAHDCYANSGNQCDLCWFEYVPTAGDRELTIDTICNETGVGAQDGFVRIVSDTAGFSEVILYSCSSQSDMTEQASDKRQFELSGLSCGPYVLECRLPKGEVRYASFVIQEYKPLWLFVNNMRHVTTSGSENGRATVSIVDGASPYQAVIIKDSELYLDTIFESSKLNLDSLGAATYHVTVIDWYGKKRSIDFVINAPQAPLRLITDSVENVSCFSYDNGVVHLRAEGGWGDYQFAPVGGQYGNSTTFGNRVAGSYSFVAIDRLGVTDTLNVDVDQPERLSVGEPMVDSVTCFGDFDGSVKFNISGGNGGYVTYSDHGFSVHGDYVDNLNSDTYKFYFSDKKRCPSLDTLVVYVPQPDSLSIGETVRNTTCGESNGSIRINVTGGVKPYTYLWNDTTISKSDDQSVVYGLRQLGLYEVKVVDRNGCGVGKSFRIGASTKPRIARVSTLPIKCTGDSNGTAMLDSADLIPATPYAPFRIIWPNGQNQMAVNDLPAGRFSVTIADTNGCSSDFGFEIKSQSPLELQKLGSRDAHCYNYTDGAISVVAFGGAGNYSFLWNTGDTLSQISNIGMGSYTVVVTDANECRDTATYSISQPDSLYVDLGYDIYMCPENTYEFDPGAYATYEWKRNDTVLSTERVLTADGQGLYCIEVTDDAGCFSHDSVYVAVGIDLLKADFVMASDAPIDDTIALIELSNMEIDSLRWEFDNGVFETIDYSDYEIYLKPDTLGMHAITLWAYSGGCVSYQTKQIEIVEQADTTATANYGYNPLIKSILLKPNPNDGQFTVDIELREAHDIGATISNVGTGAQVAGFSRSGDSKYSENVDISNSGSGVYVLRVVAGDETRSVRFMITR